MDDDFSEELKAWFEFYQEVGIENFYRRTPSPQSKTPIPTGQRVVPATAPAPTLAEQKATLETVKAQLQIPKPIMPTPKLSLFEPVAPAPARREKETPSIQATSCFQSF